MNPTKRLFLLLVILLSSVIMSILVIVQHETAHQEIYKNWGVDSHIKYSFNPFKKFPAMTIANDAQIEKERCNDSCKLAHSINESIGYHILGIITGIAVFAFLFFMWSLWSKKIR